MPTEAVDADEYVSGKWDFKDDFQRANAIAAEARFKYREIKHVAWAAAVLSVAVAYVWVHLSSVNTMYLSESLSCPEEKL